MKWNMHGHASKDGLRFTNIHESEMITKICDYSAEIVKLRVSLAADQSVPEDRKAPVYLGWLEAKSLDGPPVMIQQTAMIFDMQFPYGREAWEAKNEGRTVVLEIERA